MKGQIQNLRKDGVSCAGNANPNSSAKTMTALNHPSLKSRQRNNKKIPLSHVRNDMFKSPFLIPPVAPCGRLSFSLGLFSSASLRLQWSLLTATGFRVTHTSCCRWAHLTCLAYWNHKYSEWGSGWIIKGALLKALPGRSMSDIILPLEIICNWTRLISEFGTYVRTLVRILLSDRPLLMLFNSRLTISSWCFVVWFMGLVFAVMETESWALQRPGKPFPTKSHPRSS